MKLLKQKCKSCSAKVGYKDLWKIEMKTADGVHTIKVCTDCSKVLEEIERLRKHED